MNKNQYAFILAIAGVEILQAITERVFNVDFGDTSLQTIIMCGFGILLGAMKNE